MLRFELFSDSVGCYRFRIVATGEHRPERTRRGPSNFCGYVPCSLTGQKVADLSAEPCHGRIARSTRSVSVYIWNR